MSGLSIGLLSLVIAGAIAVYAVFEHDLAKARAELNGRSKRLPA
jgi:hypothetical protein